MDMRLSAASVIAWCSMTASEQTKHKQRTKANKEREKRARDRASNETEAQTTEDSEEGEDEPMVQGIVSLADPQEIRDCFIAELQAEEGEKAPKHLSRKPPATIGQQNDGLVIGFKKRLLALALLYDK